MQKSLENTALKYNETFFPPILEISCQLYHLGYLRLCYSSIALAWRREVKQSLCGKGLISKSGLLQSQLLLLLMILLIMVMVRHNLKTDQTFFSHVDVRDQVEELLELEVSALKLPLYCSLVALFPRAWLIWCAFAPFRLPAVRMGLLHRECGWRSTCRSHTVIRTEGGQPVSRDATHGRKQRKVSRLEVLRMTWHTNKLVNMSIYKTQFVYTLTH